MFQLKSTKPIRFTHQNLRFDLDLVSGEAVGILGANGSGKSSFFQYLKEEQSQLFPFSVSFLSQGPLTILPHLRGQDVINFLSSFLGQSIDQQIFTMMLGPDLFWKNKLSELASTYSGGEAQWLKLMMTFLIPAELYVLDEPFQHLDQQRKLGLLELIKFLKSKKKRLLLCEHQGHFLKESCDRIYTFEVSSPATSVIKETVLQRLN